MSCMRAWFLLTHNFSKYLLLFLTKRERAKSNKSGARSILSMFNYPNAFDLYWSLFEFYLTQFPVYLSFEFWHSGWGCCFKFLWYVLSPEASCFFWARNYDIYDVLIYASFLFFYCRCFEQDDEPAANLYSEDDFSGNKGRRRLLDIAAVCIRGWCYVFAALLVLGPLDFVCVGLNFYP